MHKLIMSPFLGDYLVTRPDSERGVRIPRGRYMELDSATSRDLPVPAWLVHAAEHCWGFDLTGQKTRDAVLVRKESTYGFGRASYELNLGCNYDCAHCYLGLKQFSGLSWPNRDKLLHIMRDAGVLWLQLTGGEPLIDKLFPQVYSVAWDLGMMIGISSNGSRLNNTARPRKVTTGSPNDVDRSESLSAASQRPSRRNCPSS